MIQPVSGLGHTPQGMGDLWQAFKDFWNPDVSTTDWVKGNVYQSPTPDYSPAEAPGPVVPTGALDPSTGYHPYASDYTWCSPTDTECLNSITNRQDTNLWDTLRNSINYRSAQNASISNAEKAKPIDWTPWLIVGGLGAFLLFTKHR